MNDLRPLLESFLLKANSRFELKDFLFDKQLAFVMDPAPFKTAVCSRRAGKTVSCAGHLIETATKNKEVICLYITLSRNNAKKIIWPELLRINRDYRLGARPDNTELSLHFPNGSMIYLSGAKDESEIEKFRGLPIKLCYLDESQSFKSYIKDLIDDILAPALMDYAGSICLIGTPGPIPAGYFHECSVESKNWSHHSWNFFDNPFISIKSGATHQSLLERELTRRGVGIDDPSIQREWFGKWSLDLDSLLLRYDEQKNHFTELPPGKWNYILGIDLGFVDADALAVLAWSESHPATYLIDEKVVAKQGITELVQAVHAMQLKYDLTKMVIDEGGLGKKIAEEIRRRHQIPVQPADKTRKMENVAFLNDALRTSRFKAKKNSRFAQDSFLLEIDREKTTPERLVVHDSFHSDICVVAGTKIETESGPQPIEMLRLGDKVWTRKGLRSVLAIAQTSSAAEVRELHFSNGSLIQCTPAHRFITERGKKSVDSLLYSDKFCEWQRLKQPNSMALPIGGIQNQDGILYEIILKIQRKGLFIGKSIDSLGEQFRRVCTFIMSTTIPRIIKLKTLSLLARVGIWQNILKDLTLQNNGTNRRQERNGIKNMQNHGFLKTESASIPSVPCAGNTISEILLQKQPSCFVPAHAELKLEEGLDSMISPVNVSSAINNLGIVNSKSSAFAVTLVRLERLIKKEPVYNITVEGEHEYFANGILNSNCDAVLYAFKESPAFAYTPPMEKPKYLSQAWADQEVSEMEKKAQEHFENLEKNESGFGVWG